MSKDFSDLLQEAERLTNELEGTADLPKVERSLKQVLDDSNDLYSRVAQSGSKDIQANLLLGSKGIDLPKIVQKLESISNKRTFEPIQPLDNLDIENILKNEVRNKILEVFDSSYNAVKQATFENAWKHQEAEWKQEKIKILNSLGGRSGLPIELGKHQSILIQKPSAPLSHMGAEESIYASKIMEYNTDLVKGMPKANLVNVFYGATNQFKDSKVNDMWEIIKYMIQLSPFPQSEDPIIGRYSKPIIQDLVAQGKKYLEDRYKTFMNNIVNENLAQASRGGIPGTYPLVRSFVGLRFQGEYLGLRDGVIDERPLWPMVYFCLRSGDLSAAIYCLKRSGLTEFSEILAVLEAKLADPHNPDIAKLEENIRFTYRRFIRNETDPFKRIVWSVLGCCDISDEHSEVARTADDYLWLKLSLVRVDYAAKDDCINYNNLQQIILEECGESHYDAFNQPHLYFQVLTLTGQFEAAIEFLSRVPKYKVHAVHMAIALNELYLLGGPQDTSAPLIFIDPADPKPARRLNLARLIMIYVRNFEFSCPNEALHYFYLLRNHKDSEGRSLFQICVTDLALETKEYEKLLGKMQRNGVRTKGLIDQFVDSNITADCVAELIGATLVRKGLHEEAIDIFDIANNQEEILKHLCSLLSQVVQMHSEPGSLRARLQEKTLTFATRYSREGFRCTGPLVNSFLTLRELLAFFDLYHAKEYPQALKLLSDLRLIPLTQAEVVDRVKQFKTLTTDLAKVIPDVLLATMNMLFAQYQKIRASTEYIPRHYDTSADMQLSNLRQQANAITNFAGMLPYRMPGDTNSRLVQMEILMH